MPNHLLWLSVFVTKKKPTNNFFYLPLLYANVFWYWNDDYFFLISLIPAQYLILSVEMSIFFFFFLKLHNGWVESFCLAKVLFWSRKNQPEDERGTPQKVHFLASILRSNVKKEMGRSCSKIPKLGKEWGTKIYHL